MEEKKKPTRLENLIDLAVESYGEQAVYDAVQKNFGEATLLEYATKSNLNLIIEKVTDEHTFDEVLDNLVPMCEFETLIGYMTIHGYTVFKPDNLKQQMEFEEAIKRILPYWNERNNLHLNF